MVIFIKALGIVMSLLGFAGIITPQTFTPVITFILEGKRIYAVAILRVILGIIFVAAASQCTYPAVITAFGILIISAGLMIFILRLEKTKSVIRWFLNKPPAVQRTLSGVALVFGIAVIMSA